jgi:hypothetical protein
MLKIYYKIWVSIYLKVSEAQNKDSVISALIVISAANLINCFFLLFALFFLFHFKAVFIIDFYTNHRYSAVIVTILSFFLPNYFLLVFNNKHERLLALYKKTNNKNLGIIYYWFSALLIIVPLFLMFIFPEFFGLVDASS